MWSHRPPGAPRRLLRLDLVTLDPSHRSTARRQRRDAGQTGQERDDDRPVVLDGDALRRPRRCARDPQVRAPGHESLQRWFHQPAAHRDRGRVPHHRCGQGGPSRGPAFREVLPVAPSHVGRQRSADPEPAVRLPGLGWVAQHRSPELPRRPLGRGPRLLRPTEHRDPGPGQRTAQLLEIGDLGPTSGPVQDDARRIATTAMLAGYAEL